MKDSVKSDPAPAKKPVLSTKSSDAAACEYADEYTAPPEWSNSDVSEAPSAMLPAYFITDAISRKNTAARKTATATEEMHSPSTAPVLYEHLIDDAISLLPASLTAAVLPETNILLPIKIHAKAMTAPAKQAAAFFQDIPTPEATETITAKAATGM